MKLLLLIFIMMLSSSVLADRFSSTVHSVTKGEVDESHLVRFDNGRVIFINNKDDKLLAALETSAKSLSLLNVKTDAKNFLVSAESAVDDEPYEDDPTSWSSRSEPYEPSILKNTNAAIRIFNKMRKKWTKGGECYSRAHVWSYEAFQDSGLYSMKIFMFFTERYIRKYKFGWWFHVTPMAYVASLKSPRTLDRRYTGGPRQTKTWSNVFVKSKRTCKKVSKFDDFWLNQKTQDCYHIHVSMYYRIPRDIEKRDLTGMEKTEFSEKELRRAYGDGFNM